MHIKYLNYWGKSEIKNYQARYNSVTRKYALQKAPWTLQIAMTLMDFHIDHIIDIVYHKEIWSKDYQQQINDFNGDDGNYETDILLENESEEVEEDDSESQIIGDIKTKTFTRNGAIC